MKDSDNSSEIDYRRLWNISGTFKKFNNAPIFHN